MSFSRAYHQSQQSSSADSPGIAKGGSSPSISEINSTSLESLDGGLPEITDLDSDPLLKLTDEEPEAWNATVDKKTLKKMKEKEIKRQEAIYELIITEKHHCLTLKIMQKVFAEGMVRDVQLTRDMVERIFPCLDGLLDTHMSFLRKLRERQIQESLIQNIGDVVLQQFTDINAKRIENCYGEFCSQHKNALSYYKDILKTDRKFQAFVKKYSSKPLCKGRGIPECILLVTQRVTKYPLLIDRLIKATKDNVSDYNDLQQALQNVKDILNKIDARVDEKNRENRLIQIYHKIDAKSAAFYKGNKFKKSNVLSNNRKLRFESVISWKCARGKTVDVIGIILSDIIIFLQESNQKYYFASYDNKSGIVPLQKLLVRERAGQCSKGIYLICPKSFPQPEMYELICATAKDQKVWIEEIRSAVEQCPDEDEIMSPIGEQQKIEEEKRAKLSELLVSMYENDAKLTHVCEEKMRMLSEVLELRGIEHENVDVSGHMVSLEDKFSCEAMYSVASEALRLTNSLYLSGTNLSRSVSSAGEHQSETLVSPVLPKRAETFGGFDTPIKVTPQDSGYLKKKTIQNTDLELEEENEDVTKEQVQLRNPSSASFLRVKDEIRRHSGPLLDRSPVDLETQEKLHRRSLASTPTHFTSNILTSPSHSPVYSAYACSPCDPSYICRLSTTPLIMSQGRDQLIQIVELQNQIHLMIRFFNYQQTLLVDMKSKLMEANEKLSRDTTSNYGSFSRHDKKSVYRPEHQLEELRNIQEQFTAEKSDWQKKYEEEKNELEAKKQELQELQRQIKQEQSDLTHQRELLYRKLEALQKEGIILSPTLTVVNVGPGNKSLQSETSLSLHEEESEKGQVSPVNTANIACQSNESKLSTATGASNVRQRNVTSINISSRDSQQELPMHLCSTTNILTRRSLGTNVNIKQQLPLKLAANNSMSSTSPTFMYSITQPNSSSIIIPNGFISSNSSSNNCNNSTPQQILPMKLACDTRSGSNTNPNVQQQQQQPVRSNSSVESVLFNREASLLPTDKCGVNIRNIPSASSSFGEHHHVRTQSTPAPLRTDDDNNSMDATVSQTRRKSTDEEIFC
ncbi:A-kinase anchor protein 13-like protein [Dinothrombium tinctorium]|uniref:A-kinase anchor protein 13-like protein n=1 Tax=Dinothrombium tinctorium TaxID=1965070 RepID=A0A3S3QKE4_9ACAR|nr:A-kinase anchor protein 13-like protein [Dinothrombium tinctorium]RWS10129.1 A-kinase anchor protein 13-like protein [Dinothrombium tinctorium]RWS10575.1 A-kinase anchor protein 13-like protein [Dinothrombium tinctorium]